MSAYRLSTHQIIGLRSYQEDRFVSKQLCCPNGDSVVLMVVCDGHFGSETAEIVARHFDEYFVVPHIDRATQYIRSFIASCHAETKMLNPGTTLSVALVWLQSRRVFTAVLGDSPILAGGDGGMCFASTEHNVGVHAQERERVKKLGTYYDGVYMYHPTLGVGLQLTRSLGDADMDMFLSREPEMNAFVLPQPSTLLVCSDGLPGRSGIAYWGASLFNAAHAASTAEDLIVARMPARNFDDNVTALLLHIR